MTLYQLHNDGRIARFTGMISTGWEVLDNNPATTAITAAAGNLYQLLSDGRIARYTGTPITGWEVLDNNPATAAIVAAGKALYQLLGDGRIIARRAAAPMSPFDVLGEDPATTAIAATTRVLYRLLSDGKVAQYVGPSTSGWEVLDDDSSTRAIAADNSMPMGYPDRPSVIPGGVLQLHVSTEALTFRVDLFRQGRTLEFKHSSPWYSGRLYPATYPSVRWDQDWGGRVTESIFRRTCLQVCILPCSERATVEATYSGMSSVMRSFPMKVWTHRMASGERCCSLSGIRLA
jgi:hypothetical protein